ncbi:hypothetical protein PINS_up021810 [Pythium insidiosum]|nr:hypothetical protein PINS_up007612 [Pythium insidiosum]GLE09882.1 hypothetical protein PINS_up021810 [Pythium insidiosum]
MSSITNAVSNPRAPLLSSSMAPGMSTSLSSSQAGGRDQSWRGKYLRALNICPEDAELVRKKMQAQHGHKARLRTWSYRSDVDPPSLSRSYSSSSMKSNSSAQTHGVVGFAQPPASTPTPSNGATQNPYGFALRPGISRGRRCHTDPFDLEERVSAPIQIPSASSVNNQLDGNGSSGSRRAEPLSTARRKMESPHQIPAPSVRLLSWEEPVAMLAAANAVSKGWNVPTTEIEVGVCRDNNTDEFELGLGPDSHLDGDFDDEDDDEDEIFEMEELDSDPASPEPLAPKSRRRIRTASLNVVQNGREKRSMHAHDRGLPQSFVPPHQLVQRDCFSIGLRDELKRRPANNI